MVRSSVFCSGAHLTIADALLQKHCYLRFNINAEKPKFYSSTVVYFTLADLLETKKVQEAKIGAFRCILHVESTSIVSNVLVSKRP